MFLRDSMDTSLSSDVGNDQNNFDKREMNKTLPTPVNMQVRALPSERNPLVSLSLIETSQFHLRNCVSDQHRCFFGIRSMSLFPAMWDAIKTILVNGK